MFGWYYEIDVNQSKSNWIVEVENIRVIGELGNHVLDIDQCLQSQPKQDHHQCIFYSYRYFNCV